MATKKKAPTDKVALYTDHGLFDSRFGRLPKGYSIVDPITAANWMSVSDSVRKASPEEVASAYGVK